MHTKTNVYSISFGRYFSYVNNSSTIRFTITFSKFQIFQLLKKFYTFFYRLSVNAVDSGGRFATASVNINVTDSNNHAPNFENTPYIVDVFEDTPIGSTVLMLFASDLDHGRNAKINYRLQSASETFHVERDTGALVVSSTIDRESVSTYILTVICVIL